jgi:alpha-L-rhamnosidase
MAIEFVDGSTAQVYTQANWAEPWLDSPGPILENSVYNGEVYDARLEIPAWDYTDTPLSGWLPASGADGPGGELVSAGLEPIRVMETLRARAITRPKPGVYVFDLGQNIAGWARLRVTGAVGTRLSLKFAETLYPDGTANQENLRFARAEDVYILNGRGEEVWEPRFTYHGFRYIQVEGWPGEPSAEMIEGRVVRSAVEISGAFDCSSGLINRIHKMITWTESGNLHSLPTDCPQRDERMGWLNDMAARTEEALYNYDLARLFAKWTADIADEQHPRSGAITDTAPFHWGRRPADPVSVCYLLIPWLLYVHYGDARTMAARYVGMKAWVDFLTSQAEEGILGYSYYGDWSPPVNLGQPGSLGSSAVSKDTPGSLVSTACYAYSARLLGQIARALGNAANAQAYLDLAGQIAGRFNDRFWDESTGGYGSSNQACNAISLYMDLVPVERRVRVVDNLVKNVVERWNSHLTTGNICTKYLLEALTAAGRADVAYQIASQETYPSWGYMLANGATTLWERWELASGTGMNSHNHPMLGSVGAWFYRALAGIQADPGGPGFQRFDIRPNPVGGLAHARAALETVRGQIACGWQVAGGRLGLDLTVPVGSQARVFVPVPLGGALQEGDDILWKDEQPGAELAIHREGGSLVFSVGSGEYHFQVL